MSKESPPKWDVELVQQGLGAETELTPWPDQMGIRYKSDHVIVDEYRNPPRMVITTPESQHTLLHMEHVGLTSTGEVLFRSTSDKMDKLVSVRHTGEVNIFVAPNPPVPHVEDYFPSLVDKSLDNSVDNIRADDAIDRADEDDRPETASPREIPVRVSEPPPATREKDPRQDITGRIAHPPDFKEFKGGSAKLLFHVATQLEDDSVRYHEVQVFNDEARKVQEQLKKGTEVKVLGYQKSRELKGKPGKTKPYVLGFRVILPGKGKPE